MSEQEQYVPDVELARVGAEAEDKYRDSVYAKIDKVQDVVEGTIDKVMPGFAPEKKTLDYMADKAGEHAMDKEVMTRNEQNLPESISVDTVENDSEKNSISPESQEATAEKQGPLKVTLEYVLVAGNGNEESKSFVYEGTSQDILSQVTQEIAKAEWNAEDPMATAQKSIVTMPNGEKIDAGRFISMQPQEIENL
ncbi:MAG: hypothetical protein WCP14_02105 [bacterium]